MRTVYWEQMPVQKRLLSFNQVNRDCGLSDIPIFMMDLMLSFSHCAWSFLTDGQTFWLVKYLKQFVCWLCLPAVSIEVLSSICYKFQYSGTQLNQIIFIFHVVNIVFIDRKIVFCRQVSMHDSKNSVMAELRCVVIMLLFQSL